MGLESKTQRTNCRIFGKIHYGSFSKINCRIFSEMHYGLIKHFSGGRFSSIESRHLEQGKEHDDYARGFDKQVC
jgi:hypothetical protein